MRRIFITLLIVLISLTPAYASGAMASNPNVELGNGTGNSNLQNPVIQSGAAASNPNVELGIGTGNSSPYAPGIENQQNQGSQSSPKKSIQRFNDNVPALPNANAFVSAGTKEFVDLIDSSGIGKILSAILLLLFKIGYPLAVGILIFIGVQLIIAPPQKKAEVKAALTPYFVGLLLLVAGVPIATMIIKMFVSIF